MRSTKLLASKGYGGVVLRSYKWSGNAKKNGITWVGKYRKLCLHFPHCFMSSQMFCFVTNSFNRLQFQFNQDLYPTSGVPLAASSSTSAGSHSPCSPLLPPSLSSNVAAAAAAQTSALSSSTSNTTIPTIPLGALQRHLAKEEDISTARSDTEGKDTPNVLHIPQHWSAGRWLIPLPG